MRRLVPTAVAVAALSVPLAAPAWAGLATLDDSKGDTYVAVYPEVKGGSGAPTWEESDQLANVDVDTAKVRHTDDRISVPVSYFKLTKGSEVQPQVHVRIINNAGSEWVMAGGAYLEEGEWITQVGVYAVDQELRARRGINSCEAAKVRVDWGDDLLVLSAPRSCFGTPRWVVAHVQANGYGGGDVYVDNAHNAKGNDKGLTDPVRKG